MAGLNLKIGVNVLQATREIDRLGRNISKLGARVTATNKQLNAGAASVTRFGSAAGAAATSVLQLVGALSVLGVGAAAKGAISFTSEFERSIAEINTILPEGGVKLDQYRKKLLKLSTESSKSLQDLSEALYQTISSGIPTEDGPAGAFAVLTASQKAAVAGLSTTENAVKATVAVLNSYEEGLFSATDVTDKLLVTVREGQVKFDDLARGIGRVAPIAANAGVSLDDLLGTIATITQAGVSPRETITGLRNLINSITAPTKETTQTLDRFNAVQRAAGRETVNLSAEALRNNGLLSVLQNLQRATGGSTEALREFFPNIRALLPGLILIGSKTEVAENKIRAMGESFGFTNEAAQKVDATFSETFEKVLSNIGRLAVESIDSGEDSILSRLNRDFLKLNDYLGSGQGLKAFKSFFEGVDGFVRGTVKFLNDFSLELSALVASRLFIAAGGIKFLGAAAAAASVSFGLLTKAVSLFASGLTLLGRAAVSVGSAALSASAFVGGPLLRSLASLTKVSFAASVAVGKVLFSSLLSVGSFLAKGSIRVGLLALDVALAGFMKTMIAFGTVSSGVLSGLGRGLSSLLTYGASITLMERLGPALLSLPSRAFTASVDLMIAGLARMEFALRAGLVSLQRFSVGSKLSLGIIGTAFSKIGVILSQGITVSLIEGLGPILLAQLAAARASIGKFITVGLQPLQAALAATAVRLSSVKKGLAIFLATAQSAGVGFALTSAMNAFSASLLPALASMRGFAATSLGAVVPSLVAMKAGFLSTSKRILAFSLQAVTNFGNVTKSALAATGAAATAAAKGVTSGAGAALAGTAAAVGPGAAVAGAAVGTASAIGSARRSFQEFGTNLAESGGKFRENAKAVKLLGFEFTFLRDATAATANAFANSVSGPNKLQSAIGALTGTLTVLTTTLIDIPMRVGAGLGGALAKITDWFGLTEDAANDFFTIMDTGIFDYMRQLTEIQEETERLKKEIADNQKKMDEEARDLGFDDVEGRLEGIDAARIGKVIQLDFDTEDISDKTTSGLFNLDGDFIGPRIEEAEENIERTNNSLIKLLTGQLDAFAEDPKFGVIFGEEALQIRAEIDQAEGLTSAFEKFFRSFDRQGKNTLLTWKQLNARLKQQILNYTTVDEVTAQTLSRRVTRLFIEKQIAAVVEKQRILEQQENLDKESQEYKDLQARKKNLEDQLKLLNIQTNRDAITRATTTATFKGLSATDKKASREKLINRLLSLQEKINRRIAKQGVDNLKVEEKSIKNSIKSLELERRKRDELQNQVDQTLELSRALDFNTGRSGREINFSRAYLEAIDDIQDLQNAQRKADQQQLKFIDTLEKKRKEVSKAQQAAKDESKKSRFDADLRKIDEVLESLKKVNASGSIFTSKEGGVVNIKDLKKSIANAKANIDTFAKDAQKVAKFEIEFDAKGAKDDIEKAGRESGERLSDSFSRALKGAATSFGTEIKTGFDGASRAAESFVGQIRNPLERERLRSALETISKSLGISFESAAKLLQNRLQEAARRFGGALRSQVESAENPFSKIVGDFIDKVKEVDFIELGDTVEERDAKTGARTGTTREATREDVVGSTIRFRREIAKIFIDSANEFRDRIEAAREADDFDEVERAQKSLEDFQSAIQGLGDSPDKFIEQLERLKKLLDEDFVSTRPRQEGNPGQPRAQASAPSPSGVVEFAEADARALAADLAFKEAAENFSNTVTESGLRFNDAIVDAIANVEIFNIGEIVGSVLNPILDKASELADKTREKLSASVDAQAERFSAAIDAAGLNPAAAAAAKTLVTGLGLAIKAASVVIISAFEAGARLVGETLMRVLDTIGETLMAPIDMLFGSLGDALAVLDPGGGADPAEREREERQRRKESAERERKRIEEEQKRTREVLANIKALKDAGASNEEIARAQAELVRGGSESDPLEDEREEEKSAIQTLADRIDAAVQFAVNIMNELPGILEAFLVGVIENLPTIFEALTVALVSALNVVAEKLPELVETLTVQLVAALPSIIEALIMLLPALLEALIIATTEILKGLPDIIIAFVEATIAAIPDIINALIETLPDLIAALVEAVPVVITVLVMAVPRIVMAIIKGLPRVIAALVLMMPRVIGALVRGLARSIYQALRGLGNIFANAGRVFREVTNAMRMLQEGFMNLLRQLKNLLKGIGEATGSFFGGVWDAMMGRKKKASTGERVVAAVLTLGISEFLHDGGMVEKKDPPVSPLKAFRDLGVQGFSTGGMVYDTMRQRFRASLSDEVPALLQTGEAVLNRAATARIGGEAAINAINSGAPMSPSPVNVNVGINPDAEGMSSVAAALLPMLIRSMSVSASSAGKDAYGVLGLGGRTTLGYRTVRGVD